MSDKPKLKDSEEIFSSLTKKKSGGGTAGGASRRGEEAPKQPAPGEETDRPRPSKPRVITPIASEEDEGPAADFSRRDEDDGDNQPLDMGRYNLYGGGSFRDGDTDAGGEQPAQHGAAAPGKRAAKPRRSGRAKAPDLPPVDFQEDAISFESYNFPNLDDSDASGQTPDAPAGPGEQSEAPEKKQAKKTRQKPAAKKTTKPASRGRKQEKPKNAPADAAQPAQEEEDYRSKFLERLSHQFDQEFSQRFESKPESKAPPESQESWFEQVTAKKSEAAAAPALPLEEERAIDQEAELFVEQFAQEAKQEEERRAESFKDALDEKFMRERERYLRDLGLAEEEQEAEPVPAAPLPAPDGGRRILDLQIQPEMHLQDGDTAPDRMVGHTRAPRPAHLVHDPNQHQEDPPASPLAAPGAAYGRTGAPPGAVLPGGKKSSEQLLLELAQQTRTHAQQKVAGEDAPKPKRPAVFTFQPEAEATGGAEGPPEQGARPPAAKKKPRTSRKMIKMNMDAPQEKPKSQEKLAAIIIAVGLCVIIGLGFGAFRYLTKSDNPLLGESGAATAQNTLTMLESRSFETERGNFENVYIKRSNLMLKNCTVTNYLVIDEIESEGVIQLDDVTVEGSIYLNGCAVDQLELNNVQAERIIINNEYPKVTVLRASGLTNVGALETRTPLSIEQEGLSADADGVRSLVSTERENGGASLTLSGVSLQTLSTAGETLVELKGDSKVDTFTAEGALSLSGSGSVVTLSVGAPEEDRVLPVNLKNVAVQNLNVKNHVSIDVSTKVDTMATSSNLELSGNGSIGTLSLNYEFGESRLLGDFSGTNIAHLIVNTPARIYSLSGCQINTLTANESVWALGKKVNYLIVNSNGVIYENQPDGIKVESGITPPETMADNPNLDYQLGAVALSTDATGDDTSTTCGHDRDVGGFVLGDGSRENPFVISNPAQLAHINEHLSSHYVQTADINIADDSQFASGFPMIGAAGSPFSGSYDGGGYTISNLRINSSSQSVGLFAENIGTIQNVRVSSGEVSSSAGGISYAGGIVGFQYQNGSLTSSYNGAKVTGNASTYVGGLVGYNFGGNARIRDCYNTALITGESYVGGVVGMNHTEASVTGCYNAGTVDAVSAVGAVVGSNNDGVVTNCYYLADTAEEGIGVGSGSAAERTSDEMMSAQMVADLTAGNDASLWTRGDTAESGYNYPVLRRPTAGAGTPAAPAAANDSDSDDDV